MIVAARTTNQPSDKEQAVAMVKEAIENTGEVPKELSADAGFCSAKAVEELCAQGVDPFIALEKTRHGTRLPPAPRGRMPKGLSAKDRMRRKLRTKHCRERYALRMETAEPVFGQIKQGRCFGQFLLRGLEKVNREWQLICAGHNLLKLFRFGARRSGKGCCNGLTGNRKPPQLAAGKFSLNLSVLTSPRRPHRLSPANFGRIANQPRYSSDGLREPSREEQGCNAIYKSALPKQSWRYGPLA